MLTPLGEQLLFQVPGMDAPKHLAGRNLEAPAGYRRLEVQVHSLQVHCTDDDVTAPGSPASLSAGSDSKPRPFYLSLPVRWTLPRSQTIRGGHEPTTRADR